MAQQRFLVHVDQYLVAAKRKDFWLRFVVYILWGVRSYHGVVVRDKKVCNQHPVPTYRSQVFVQPLCNGFSTLVNLQCVQLWHLHRSPGVCDLR